jgi:hypothetical protein
LKVLVACEYSGTVRDAFIARGHDAMSCDLLPTDAPGPHYQGDIFECLNGDDYCESWDLIIAHPPCTHLSVSGARHFAVKRADGRQQEAIDFFLKLANLKYPHIAIENPICIMSSIYRKPDQVIQPWQFGHGETKATCLWLKGLPKLQATYCVGGDLFTPAAPLERDQRIWKMPPSPDRWKERSKTYQGIADAMADQWGKLQ